MAKKTPKRKQVWFVEWRCGYFMKRFVTHTKPKKVPPAHGIKFTDTQGNPHWLAGHYHVTKLPVASLPMALEDFPALGAEDIRR